MSAHRKLDTLPQAEQAENDQLLMLSAALDGETARAETGAAKIGGTAEGSAISGVVSFEDTKEGLRISARLRSGAARTRRRSARSPRPLSSPRNGLEHGIASAIFCRTISGAMTMPRRHIVER